MPSIPQQSIMEYINHQADMIVCPDCNTHVGIDAIEMTIAHRKNESCNLFINYYVHCGACENYAHLIEEFAVSSWQKIIVEDWSIEDLRTDEWVNNVES